MAQLSPLLASTRKVKPLVIDPLNYERVFDLLEMARKKNISERNLSLIKDLNGRIEQYLDPKAIQVIPYTIQEAYKKYGPDLAGVADIVVDVAGAIYYASLEKKREVYQLERNWLLKNPNGILYTDQKGLE